MALSASQRRANDKYIKENYRQVKLSMPKDEAETLEYFLFQALREFDGSRRFSDLLCVFVEL